MPDMQITNPESAPIYDAGNLREGSDRGTKVLFAGDEGRLDNYRWFYSSRSASPWKAASNIAPTTFSTAETSFISPKAFITGRRCATMACRC
jgi:hypothetical protein